MAPDACRFVQLRGNDASQSEQDHRRPPKRLRASTRWRSSWFKSRASRRRTPLITVSAISTTMLGTIKSGLDSIMLSSVSPSSQSPTKQPHGRVSPSGCPGRDATRPT